jgi:DNA processing protein
MLEKLALTFIPKVGCKSLRQLIDITGSAEKVFELKHNDLVQIFGNHTDIIDAIEHKTTFARAEEELAFAEKHHIKILWFTDANYPQRLNRPDCEDTPPLLYYIGDADLNAQKVVSIVGTRRATEYGKEMTRLMVKGLQQEGILVVSGLAYGIDTASHKAAREFGLPTIGVVAHGLDTLYPPQNRSLAKEMASSNGGLITEYPSRTAIHPSYFPARNRIIAALSDAVVVVEAGVKGGALITANLANGYHRDVLAFPGRVSDKYSEGCNRIISNGKATLVQDSDELFAIMGWERKSSPAARQQRLVLDLTGDQTTIYNILSAQGPMPIEEMAHFCDLPLPKIATELLGLELKGICKCLPGKVYKLA